MKGQMKPLIQKILLGFASGVMVAASVWSLLIPSMEMSENMGKYAFIPAAAGFLLGIFFLLMMDQAVPHLHMGAEKSEGPKCSLKKQPCLSLPSHFIIFRKEWRSAWFSRGCSRGTQKLQWQVRLRCRSALRSRTSRREQLFPCR